MDFFLVFFAFYFFIILVVIPLVFFIKIWGYLYPLLFWGAIYVPTTEERVEKMVKLLEVKPGQTAVDLGAGDGRLVIALAETGIEAHGYEIKPFLVLRAQKNIKKAGLENKAFVHLKNLWKEDLKGFDIVVLYAMAHMMKKIEKKFEKELKPGAKIVSNFFTLPTWKPDKVEDNIYLYIKK